MSLKQWLWLLVWLLIFLIIFCIWDKLNYFKNHNEQIIHTTPSVQTLKTDVNQKNEEKKERDVYLKIIKDQETIKISGIFPNRETADKVVAAYSKLSPTVDTSDIMIHKDAQNDKIIDLAISMQDELSQFDSGYIDYSDKKLVIDGITDDAKIKDSILKKASSIEGITLDNKVILREDANNQNSDEPILEDINDIKDSIYHNKGIPTVAQELEEDDKNSVEKNNSNNPENINPKEKTPSKEATHKEQMPKKEQPATKTQKSKNINKTHVKKPVHSTNQKKKINKNKDAQKALNDILKYKKVEFVYAKAKLTRKGQRVINRVVKVLNKYKNIKIEIGGHTDSDGTRKRNKELSKRRAEAIKAYLIKKGIAANRLKAVGYGESRPLVKNDSAKNKQKNRRVEFKVIGRI